MHVRFVCGHNRVIVWLSAECIWFIIINYSAHLSHCPPRTVSTSCRMKCTSYVSACAVLSLALMLTHINMHLYQITVCWSFGKWSVRYDSKINTSKLPYSCYMITSEMESWAIQVQKVLALSYVTNFKCAVLMIHELITSFNISRGWSSISPKMFHSFHIPDISSFLRVKHKPITLQIQWPYLTNTK